MLAYIANICHLNVACATPLLQLAIVTYNWQLTLVIVKSVLELAIAIKHWQLLNSHLYLAVHTYNQKLPNIALITGNCHFNCQLWLITGK